MLEASISEREPESYQDFAYRFQLAEGLPCDEKGIIFIGNTRAGKSTLALAMNGAAMKVVYDCGELTFINPSDMAYKDIVRNTHQSVTEKPNFYPRRQGHNRYAIVDMPGHADSSRFRQLINFHYIRTMAANLKEVRFLIVVTLQNKGGKFEMPEKELQMLNSFRIMFPNCSDCVNIVINRIQNANVNAAPACACFRETVMQAGSEISSFYQNITNNRIHVIERPPYQLGRHGEKEHEVAYNAINRRMQEICNSEAQFMRLSQNSLYSPKIFKEDNVQNTEFYRKLMVINRRIDQGVAAAGDLLKQTLSIILRAILAKGQINPCGDQLINIFDIFDIFLAKYSIDTPQKRTVKPIQYNARIILESTKILQILSVISEQRFNFSFVQINNEEDERRKLRYKQQYCRDFAEAYSSKLLQIVQIAFGNGQLYEKVMDLYIFLLRRIDEGYFIAHILQEQDVILPQQQRRETGELYRKFEDYKNMSPEFLSSFDRLVQETVDFSVPNLFKGFNPSQYQQLKNEIFDNFSFIETRGQNLYSNKDNFNNVIIPQMDAKKQEIRLFVILHSEPTTPQLSLSHIQNLLQMYQFADVNARVPMVHKLVKLLQRQKQYKHALVLCIHLSLNEDAMRLVDLLQPTLTKGALAGFFSEVASGFEENGMLQYAIRALEMAKRNSVGELDRFIQYQRRILNLNHPAYASKIIQERLQTNGNEGFWNWYKIKDEVLFLKQKFRLRDQSPTKPIMLRNYR